MKNLVSNKKKVIFLTYNSEGSIIKYKPNVKITLDKERYNEWIIWGHLFPTCKVLGITTTNIINESPKVWKAYNKNLL